jgi:mutator protein MutT
MKRIDVAIAVILGQGKILICQRRTQDTFGDFWEFPGGKCEKDEDLETCLARELMEEIAIEASITRKLTSIHHDYPHAQVTLHPFLCEHRAGTPTPIECQNVKWVDPQELTDYRFPPANESLLREILQALPTKTNAAE